MHNEGDLVLGLTYPLMMKVMMTIDKDQGLPQVRHFSHDEEHYWRRKHKSPSPRGLRNDAMSRALDQLSNSPFTHHIEGAILPRRFQQPTFDIYNGKTDPVEHVSQFNQRMVVPFKNETLMCKIFQSSLGLVAMR